MAKIKFPDKKNMAAPIEADEVGLVSAFIGFRDGGAIVTVALIDSGSGALVSELPIHTGTPTIGSAVNLKKLESDLLKVVRDSGALPSGGDVEG